MRIIRWHKSLLYETTRMKTWHSVTALQLNKDACEYKFVFLP